MIKFIIPLLIIAQSFDNTTICEMLEMVQNQECKDNPSTFCQYINEAVSELCPNKFKYLVLNLLNDDIDYGCKYRQMYSPCPKDMPYCKNGECFDKPQNFN